MEKKNREKYREKLITKFQKKSSRKSRKKLIKLIVKKNMTKDFLLMRSNNMEKGLNVGKIGEKKTNRRKNGFFRLLKAPLAPQVGSELTNEKKIIGIQFLMVS